MPARSPWDRWSDPVWTLLGGIELTYHPAVAIALLAGIDVVFSPMPVVSVHPFALSLTGEGVRVTRLLEGVVLVDFLADVAAVTVAGWLATDREGSGDE